MLIELKVLLLQCSKYSLWVGIQDRATGFGSLFRTEQALVDVHPASCETDLLAFHLLPLLAGLAASGGLVLGGYGGPLQGLGQQVPHAGLGRRRDVVFRI